VPTKPITFTRSKQLSSPTPWFIAATVCVIISVAMIGVTIRFLGRSTVTQGTVTALTEMSGQDDKTYYAPEYSFTVDGRAYIGVSKSGSNPPAFAVGQSIRVRYDKTNPASNSVDTFFSLWGFSTISAALACLFAFLGILMRRAKQRRRQSAVFPAK
jgi:hypothetical protein